MNEEGEEDELFEDINKRFKNHVSTNTSESKQTSELQNQQKQDGMEIENPEHNDIAEIKSDIKEMKETMTQMAACLSVIVLQFQQTLKGINETSPP